METTDCGAPAINRVAAAFAGDPAGFDAQAWTARWLAEHEAGRARFGKYRNPFTDDADVQGVDRTVANTTPVWHAGRMLMAKEDGRPYQVDPLTLETIGSYDFGGALKSETMTAHVRIDAATGELFFYGYEADGCASTKVAYCVVGPDGTLRSEQWFDAPYCAMMHDFTISENPNVRFFFVPKEAGQLTVNVIDSNDAKFEK